jgi:hypothetical protein
MALFNFIQNFMGPRHSSFAKKLSNPESAIFKSRTAKRVKIKQKVHFSKFDYVLPDST